MIMNTLNQIVRYVNLADHNPRKFTKVDKDFTKKHDFNDIKLPVKIRDIHKMEKGIPMALVPLLMEIKKQKHPIYASKNILSCVMILYIVEENIFFTLLTSF